MPCPKKTFVPMRAPFLGGAIDALGGVATLVHIVRWLSPRTNSIAEASGILGPKLEVCRRHFRRCGPHLLPGMYEIYKELLEELPIPHVRRDPSPSPCLCPSTSLKHNHKVSVARSGPRAERGCGEVGEAT